MRLFTKILKTGLVTEALPERTTDAVALARDIDRRAQALFGRALAIREVDAGSCNGCEVEIANLPGPVYDMERFGLHFVASPRHADMLLVTGPVTRNMAVPLRKTYEATPDPKLVVAVGDCARTCGVFAGIRCRNRKPDEIRLARTLITGSHRRSSGELHRQPSARIAPTDVSSIGAVPRAVRSPRGCGPIPLARNRAERPDAARRRAPNHAPGTSRMTTGLSEKHPKTPAPRFVSQFEAARCARFAPAFDPPRVPKKKTAWASSV